MKKHSKIFSYKLGWPCLAISSVCSTISNISDVELFTSLALVSGLIAVPCMFVELIKTLQDEKACKANSNKGSGA